LTLTKLLQDQYQVNKGLEALPKQARACRLVGWLNSVILMEQIRIK